MTNEFKPCPFCGTEAELLFSKGESGKKYYWVACKKCNCLQTIFDTPQEAISAWNYRPIEDNLSEQVEKLKKEKELLRDALDVVYTFLEPGSDYSDVIFDSVSNALKATAE